MLGEQAKARNGQIIRVTIETYDEDAEQQGQRLVHSRQKNGACNLD